MEQDKIMKILYCITRSTWGGAQENIWELIKNQVKLNNEATLVVGNDGDLAKKVRENLPKVRVIILSSLQRSINPVKDTKAVHQLRRIIKEVKPDIVHLHSSKAGVIGRLACVNLNCKVLFTVHGWSFTDGIASKKKKMIFRLIERSLEPLTDKYICVSKYDYNIGIRDGVIRHPKKACVVYNGVNYEEKKQKSEVTQYPIKFIMTARFSEQKDQIGLIKAFKDTKDCRLTFVGDGPTMMKAKKLVLQNHLEDRINFVGFQKNVDKFLSKNDVFILSTHYEGLPISIIEAMSHAMPVIASNVGGNSELVINNENGFLTNNISTLKEAIMYFVKNPEKIHPMGKQSLKIYVNNFILNNFLNKTQGIYDELIK